MSEILIDFDIEELENTIEFEIVSSEMKPYTGEYVITPKVTEQYMKTKERSMTDDVTVKEIPIHEVSNNFGTTIIIGGII